jgi:hypothetical protein
MISVVSFVGTIASINESFLSSDVGKRNMIQHIGNSLQAEAPRFYLVQANFSGVFTQVFSGRLFNHSVLF